MLDCRENRIKFLLYQNINLFSLYLDCRIYSNIVNIRETLLASLQTRVDVKDRIAIIECSLHWSPPCIQLYFTRREGFLGSCDVRTFWPSKRKMPKATMIDISLQNDRKCKCLCWLRRVLIMHGWQTYLISCWMLFDKSLVLIFHLVFLGEKRISHIEEPWKHKLFQLLSPLH